MARPSSCPVELRQRAVRMVQEMKSDYPSAYAAIAAVANKLGIRNPETVRKWVSERRLTSGSGRG